MNPTPHRLHYPAILVAAAGTFLLGGLWYTVLFGEPWRIARGYSLEKLEEMQAVVPPPVFFSVLFGCYLAIAFVLALVVARAGAVTAKAGALLGFLIWVLVAAVGLTGHIASDAQSPAYAIDTGYQLLYLTGAGALLAAWRKK